MKLNTVNQKGLDQCLKSINNLYLKIHLKNNKQQDIYHVKEILFCWWSLFTIIASYPTESVSFGLFGFSKSLSPKITWKQNMLHPHNNCWTVQRRTETSMTKLTLHHIQIQSCCNNSSRLFTLNWQRNVCVRVIYITLHLQVVSVSLQEAHCLTCWLESSSVWLVARVPAVELTVDPLHSVILRLQESFMTTVLRRHHVLLLPPAHAALPLTDGVKQRG